MATPLFKDSKIVYTMTMQKKRGISGTPRKEEHSRKVQFSVKMREKISENWVELRKSMKTTKKKPKKKND